MITSVEIENLRGIRHGKLEGLRPLTILTGPNGGGKSTVLDALLIGASPEPGDAVGRAVSRHPLARNGAKWLFPPTSSSAVIQVRGPSEAENRRRRLEYGDGCHRTARARLVAREASGPFSTVQVHDSAADFTTYVCFGSDNLFDSFSQDAAEKPFGRFFAATLKEAAEEDLPQPTQRVLAGPEVFLIDAGLPAPLSDAYSRVAALGRKRQLNDIVAPLVPAFESLEVLTQQGEPFLSIVSTHGATPISLAGDGIQALVQVALETALAAPDDTVLLEEPEVYQHPRAIWKTAEALLANVRRGVQIVLTTHSLELIDALISKAGEKDLDKLALFNMLLQDGELVSGRRQGEEISFARETLEKDLR